MYTATFEPPYFFKQVTMILIQSLGISGHQHNAFFNDEKGSLDWFPTNVLSKVEPYDDNGKIRAKSATESQKDTETARLTEAVKLMRVRMQTGPVMAHGSFVGMIMMMCSVMREDGTFADWFDMAAEYVSAYNTAAQTGLIPGIPFHEICDLPNANNVLKENLTVLLSKM